MKKKHTSKGKVESKKSILDLLEENDKPRDKSEDKIPNKKAHD